MTAGWIAGEVKEGPSERSTWGSSRDPQTSTWWMLMIIMDSQAKSSPLIMGMAVPAMATAMWDMCRRPKIIEPSPSRDIQLPWEETEVHLDAEQHIQKVVELILEPRVFYC